MRKSLGLFPVLIVAMWAPAAHADQFQYTYTLSADGYSLTWTTNPMPVVTGQVDIPVANLASFSVTGSAWAAYTLTGVALDLTGADCVGGCVGGVQDSAFTQPPSIFISSINDTNEGVTAADYGISGDYIHSGPILVQDYTCCGVFYVQGTDTLEVTEINPTPEPSSLLLLGTVFGAMILLAVSRRLV